MNAVIHNTVAGDYRIRVLRADGSLKTDSGWFKNLITTSGLDHIGKTNNTLFQRCYVGTSNQVPAMSDTALIASLGYVNDTILSTTYTYDPTDQYYEWSNTYAFTMGAIVGNIAEVGVGPNDGADLSLMSRALVVDGSGNPTTISVLVDEILQVTYRFRVYIDVTDRASIVSIGGIDRNCIIRPAMISHLKSRDKITVRCLMQTSSGSAVGPLVYETQTLGAIDSSPAGTSSGSNTVSVAAYVAGNFYNDLTISYSTAQGNLAAGVGSLAFTHCHGSWQISFDPVLDKTSLKIMSFTIRVSWANHP